jgi:hypothetical protein
MNDETRAELLGLSARVTCEISRLDRLQTEHGDELPKDLASDLAEFLDLACSLVTECERLKHVPSSDVAHDGETTAAADDPDEAMVRYYDHWGLEGDFSDLVPTLSGPQLVDLRRSVPGWLECLDDALEAQDRVGAEDLDPENDMALHAFCSRWWLAGEVDDLLLDLSDQQLGDFCQSVPGWLEYLVEAARRRTEGGAANA